MEGGRPSTEGPGVPASIREATDHQPRARITLAAALASGPSHAYLFQGPSGAGKRAAARAMAAELIAASSADPAEARRRVLLDPSPHPDLVWLTPSGATHLVADVREQVIRAVSLRPFEGGRRVFVIDSAEAMGVDSQNALLKTLEEPPAYAHLLLVSSEPELLRETITSRCQAVQFAPLPAAALRDSLEGIGDPEAVAAAAALAGGDARRARFLLSEAGARLRSDAEACAAAAIEGPPSAAPWQGLLEVAESAGSEAESAAAAGLEEEQQAGGHRSAREAEQEARRIGRRHRTEALDLGLELCGLWLRDLVAVSAGAEEVVLNSDRLERLRSQAGGLDQRRGRCAVELVNEARRRLELNVSEELALDALRFRLEALLAAPA